ATLWILPSSPASLILRTCERLYVRINESVQRSSHDSMGIPPNCSVTVCSSISAILKPMKMILNEQYGLVWEFLLPWETSISICNKPKVSNSPSVSVYILGSSLWGRWGVKGGRSSWHWVKCPTLPPGYKDWQSPIRLRSVKRPLA